MNGELYIMKFKRSVPNFPGGTEESYEKTSVAISVFELRISQIRPKCGIDLIHFAACSDVSVCICVTSYYYTSYRIYTCKNGIWKLVTRLLKKFPVHYGTGWRLTVFTKVRNLSISRVISPVRNLTPYSFKSILILVLSTHFSCFKCMSDYRKG
jgi:hypothetical protein